MNRIKVQLALVVVVVSGMFWNVLISNGEMSKTDSL